MALTNFFIQSGGSNVNAGSTNANAASVTSTNGSWDVTGDTFIPAGGGTPFSGVSAGEWASIYLDAATVAVFIAQIATVNGGGASITLSTTIKFGTKPASGATGRSCKVGGAHASELPWASGGLGSTTSAVSAIVNWKAATYTVVASRTFSLVGTTVFPLIFQGYNSTPGDCNGDPSQARPVISQNATFVWTVSGAFQTWLNFNVTGNRTGTVLSCTGASGAFFRIRSENTSSNAGAIAVSDVTNIQMFFYCWFKCPTTATTTGTSSIGISTQFVGCVFEGGGIAGLNGTTGGHVLLYCIFINNTGSCILMSTGRLNCFNCTFYNPTGDAIKFTGAPAGSQMIVACLFSNVGGFAINNASGTNSAGFFRLNNDFFSITSGNYNGMGDYPDYFPQTEAASPFLNTGTSNYGLKTTALAIANGAAPGGFETIPNTVSYLDIGAVQAQNTGTGAGFIPQIME